LSICLSVCQATALIRFFHASPQLGRLDFFVNGVVAATLDYATIINYLKSSSGTIEFGVAPTGTSAISPKGMFPVIDGMAYTISVVGLTNPVMVMTLDDITVPPPPPVGFQARFHVVNFAEGTTAITANVTLTNSSAITTVFPNINYLQASPYLPIVGGSNNITFFENSRQLLRVRGAPLPTGEVFTIFAIGTTFNLDHPFGVLLTNDKPDAILIGLPGVEDGAGQLTGGTDPNGGTGADPGRCPTISNKRRCFRNPACKWWFSVPQGAWRCIIRKRFKKRMV